MNTNEPDWLREGEGIPPTVRWAFETDAPLVAMEMGRESGEVLAADAAGGLYRINRKGEVLAVSRGLKNIRAVVWCDVTSAGAVLVGEKKLYRLSGKLEADWSMGLPDAALGLAMAPFGRQIAVSMANGTNLVLGMQSEQLSVFNSSRPLKWIQFLAAAPVLVGAAEFAHIAAYQLSGQQIWSVRGFTSLGEMTASGDGETVFLAGFNHGIQTLDSDGESRESYLMEGTVSRVSCSFNADRLAAATMERHLYWLDSDGQLLWAAQVDDDIVRVICDPLGEWLLCGFASGQIMRLDWES